ncbi:MAG: S8 family peptidase [Chloroflexota bacterium]
MLKQYFPYVVAIILLAALASPSLAQTPLTDPNQNSSLDFVSGEILVQFEPNLGLFNAQQMLATEGLQTLSVSPYSGLMRVKVEPGQEMAIVEQLQSRGDVTHAGVNANLSITNTPNDPDFPLQWDKNNTGQSGGVVDADIDAVEAWDIHTGGSTPIIAIIDSGVDLDHEDLVANLWINSGEIAGNGLDDDSNGYIDDINGWNFCNGGCGVQGNNPDDDNGHGTHVAGIAAAVGNNGKGIAGVSWSARIMAVKATNSGGNGTVGSVTEAINYAVANGATVINMSIAAVGLSHPCSGTLAPIETAMKNALAQGVLMSVSSGNQSAAQVACPATYTEAIAVGSTTRSDIRASTSNRGPRLDVAAPGDFIYSTARTGGYVYMSGTSMAAPQVAGLIALLQSYDTNLNENDIRSIVEYTVDDLGTAGFDNEFGYGRINAHRALQALTNLQTSPSALSFLVDDTAATVPAMGAIQLTSSATTNVTWTTSISPAVTWLNVTSPSSGTISTAASPLNATVETTRPTTYGVYSTTVVISGVDSTGQLLGTRSTKVQVTYTPKISNTYLPIITKSALPDLEITGVTVSDSTVSVAIKNQGSTPVTDGFWVDLYIDPSSAPTSANQHWFDLASQGLVWGVTTPVAPGQTLTLTIGDSYYSTIYSTFSGSIAAGTPIYVKVDSVNLNTTYGGVIESNEGNNIFGPTYSTQLFDTNFTPKTETSQTADDLLSLPSR